MTRRQAIPPIPGRCNIAVRTDAEGNLDAYDIETGKSVAYVRSVVVKQRYDGFHSGSAELVIDVLCNIPRDEGTP